MDEPVKLPVILVTGFLGSGKTTFLRHLATEHPDRNLVILVNEFAETDVDAGLIEQHHAGIEAHSVLGGSLFCECKAGEFVRVMKERIAPMHQQGHFDALVIETSGIADPEAIGHIMTDFRLDEWFTITQIISVVAPGRFLRLVRDLRSIAAQIRTSDRIIINKIDLSGEEELRSVEASIRTINPFAEITRTSHGRATLSPDFRRHSSLPLGELSTCESNPFTTETLHFENPQEFEPLKRWFDSLPPGILRVKGHVLTERGWFFFSKSVDDRSVTPSAGSSGSGSLVLIAPDPLEDLLHAEIARISNPPNHEPVCRT